MHDGNDYLVEKIWDPVTRLWHWILVVVVALCWALGRFMDFDTIDWHFFLGYSVLGLLMFRLIWGLFGPEHARLRGLMLSPASAIAYLRTMPRRKPSGYRGHTPAGALSVIALLSLLSAQSIIGLFLESDDFYETAPLNKFVSSEWANTLGSWHHTLANVLLALVILHVAAILFYLLWKRENLIRPMITGWKSVWRD